jgi:hypothetical protein
MYTKNTKKNTIEWFSKLLTQVNKLVWFNYEQLVVNKKQFLILS